MLLFFILISVSTQAKSFPYVGRNYMWPARMDDGQYAAGQGYPNVANQDTPDDDFYEAQAGGPNAVPQAATTLAPASGSPSPAGDSSSSSSSSSEEEAGSTAAAGGGGAATTAPVAGPIRGAGGNQAAGAGADAGQSSGDVEAAVGGPVPPQPQAGAGANNAGDTSNQVDPGVPAPLNLEAHSAMREKESARASTAIALTTFFIVAGVAATSIVAYKYKDAIKARMGL